MMKIKALTTAVVIVVLAFIIAFLGINVVMKIVVGHRNEVVVPNLTGENFDVARKRCKGMKLYVEQSGSVHSDEIEKGRIVSQEPHADIKIKKFRTIKVVVSEGPEMVRLPFLENLSVVEAKLKLENVGLFLGKKNYQYSDEVEKDKVIYSQPMADELIARRSKVDVVISLGKMTKSGSSSSKWENLLGDD